MRASYIPDRRLVLLGAAGVALVLAQLNFFEWFCGFSAHYEALQLDELLTTALVLTSAGAWLSYHDARQLRHAVAEVQSLKEQADAAARLDILTGLPNRRALEDFASKHDPRLNGSDLTVLISDLNHFKQVNDTHGHRAGDIVLREIGARFRAVQSDHDDLLIVRFGGDEFACVIRHQQGDDLAERVAQRLEAAARRPIHLGSDLDVELSVSIGVACVRQGASIDDALAEADAAMYAAKRDGGRGLLPVSEIAPFQGAAGSWRRRLLERHVERPLAGNGPNVFAAALRIDRYNAVRATIGHSHSNQLVRELTERLAGCADEIVIDRMSPDTIGIAFEARTEDEALEFLEQLRAGAEGSVAVGGHVVDVTITFGYAGPAALAELRAVAEQAQIALDQALASHRRSACFCEVEYGDPSDRLTMMSEMRAALANGEIMLAYQPKVRLQDNSIDAAEALIRWEHPVRGRIAPDDFVQIAEETGDIREMTEWVLQQAIKDQMLMARCGSDLPVYVNVSGRLIGDESFTKRLLEMIGGANGRIGIEITETAVIDNPEIAMSNLRLLADAGVRVSIDDYGAGMSSLNYLKQLPVQELKIDRQFITHLAESHRDPLIVRSTIDLAHGLGMEVTAEGVESESSRALLRVMGCDLIQGFLITPALPILSFLQFCRDHRKAEATAPQDRFERAADFWLLSSAMTS
ncbi:GGDEF domain-containing phosphodiesterase [Allosphingosinicella deserti]|nr:GGDEF domain-containing phosphodiesterase [Sphingomonas deserti]